MKNQNTMVGTGLDTAYALMQRRIEHFRLHEKKFKAPSYSEMELRADFLNKFLQILGWDSTHDVQRDPSAQEVKVEKRADVSGGHKKADYAFFVQPNFSDPIWYMEAKKPSVHLTTKDNYFQAIRYGWNGQVPLVALSNFDELHLLDSRFKPHADGILNKLIKKFHYSQLQDPNVFKQIYFLLSRPAVAAGSISQFVKTQFPIAPSKTSVTVNVRSKQLIQPIDTDFLNTLEDIRQNLARAFVGNGVTYSSQELTEMTQRVLDRLVFIRFLEDKEIEPEAIFERWWESGSVWANFIASCKKLDETYNGIVFKHHDIIDKPNFKIDDEIFSDICKTLKFSEETPYLFNTIPIDILGSIYERFLGKVISVAGKKVTLLPKPDARKDNGIYYTPRHIVNFIVQEAVGKRIIGKSPKDIQQMRFVDMACGSGSFLIATFDLLLRYHTAFYNAHPKENKRGECYTDKLGALHLSLQKKREILINNIFGVDIDQQAVEVAQLSLYLKLLEDEKHASSFAYQREFHNAILPSLNRNILCGNSLIDRRVAGEKDLSPGDESLLNPFDWSIAFKHILDAGGFDAVVGNPPYLNVDATWGKKDFRLELLKSAFPEVYTDKTDLFYYFLAKAVSIAKGAIGFIVSRAMLEAYKAAKLRKHLTAQSIVRQIVDFKNHYVFPKVGITTALLFLDSGQEKDQSEVFNLEADALPPGNLIQQLPDTNIFSHNQVPAKRFGEEPWIVKTQAAEDIYKTIDQNSQQLSAILIAGQGMQTGRNDVFGEHDWKTIREWGLRKGQYFNRATNTDIQKYWIRNTGEFLIYLEDISAFNDLTPELQAYLKSRQDELKKRAAFKRGNCDWWKYTWPLHKDNYHGPKLLCPYLSRENRFALDADERFLGLTDTTVLFPGKHKEDLNYFLGLLNSDVLTYRFRGLAKLKSAGMYEYFWNSVGKLPLKRISWDNARDQKLHRQIVHDVNQINSISLEYVTVKSDHAKKNLESKRDYLLSDINTSVAELYGLTRAQLKAIQSTLEKQLAESTEEIKEAA